MLSEAQIDILRQNISSSLLQYDLTRTIELLDRYPALLLDSNYKITYFFIFNDFLTQES